MATTLKLGHRNVLRGLLFLGLSFVLLVLVIGIITVITVTHLGGSTVDCGAPPPVTKRTSPDQAVFTARVLYVGRVDPQHAMISGLRVGPWAIASVKHSYFGLPWWSSKMVVLAAGRYKEGETYFVDGKNWSGYRRFLPIIYVGACNRTQPLSEAVVDTRILSHGPLFDAVRIIGRTYRRKSNVAFEPAPGMPVEITGPNGSVIVTSDADAVYDFTGPSGQYSIQIGEPDRRNREEGDQGKTLLTGEVWERSVYSK